jgi:hypothetical protein
MLSTILARPTAAISAALALAALLLLEPGASPLPQLLLLSAPAASPALPLLSASATSSAAASAAVAAAPPSTEQLLYDAAFHQHLTPLLLPAAQLAPGTHAAQRLLHAHQHPATCGPPTKFAVSFGNDRAAGLGSNVHTATQHLAVAMELGRVFVWHQDALAMYASGGAEDDCPPGTSGSAECFLLAPSSCTLADARAPGADTIDLRFGLAGKPFGMHWTHVPRAMLALWRGERLAVVVDAETQQPEQLKYWFRAQATAFLLRFNAHALAEMRRLRLGAAVRDAAGAKAAADESEDAYRFEKEMAARYRQRRRRLRAAGGGGNGAAADSGAGPAARAAGAGAGEGAAGGPAESDGAAAGGPAESDGAAAGVARGAATAAAEGPPFPFPSGTVSMHVRHGDKGVEMTLVPTINYWRAAEALVFDNPIALARRGAFISTEDGGAVEESRGLVTGGGGGGGGGGSGTGGSAGEELVVGPGWRLWWFDVPRNNIDGRTQIEQFTKSGGNGGGGAGGAGGALTPPQLSRIWFLQLLMALECDAWVGTRGSNWNRLIDELRCVWVPKCMQPYVEVGEREERGRRWFNAAP